MPFRKGDLVRTKHPVEFMSGLAGTPGRRLMKTLSGNALLRLEEPHAAGGGQVFWATSMLDERTPEPGIAAGVIPTAWILPAGGSSAPGTAASASSQPTRVAASTEVVLMGDPEHQQRLRKMFRGGVIDGGETRVLLYWARKAVRGLPGFPANVHETGDPAVLKRAVTTYLEGLGFSRPGATQLADHVVEAWLEEDQASGTSGVDVSNVKFVTAKPADIPLDQKKLGELTPEELRRLLEESQAAASTATQRMADEHRYVDEFWHSHYDIDYRHDGGNLSKWLRLSYPGSGGVEVHLDLHLDAIVTEDMSDDAARNMRERAHVGPADRLYPDSLNQKTTPRLHAVKQAALVVMDEYLMGMILMSFPVVFSILTMGVGTNSAVATRTVRVPRAQAPMGFKASGQVRTGGNTRLPSGARPPATQTTPPTRTVPPEVTARMTEIREVLSTQTGAPPAAARKLAFKNVPNDKVGGCAAANGSLHDALVQHPRFPASNTRLVNVRKPPRNHVFVSLQTTGKQADDVIVDRSLFQFFERSAGPGTKPVSIPADEQVVFVGTRSELAKFVDDLLGRKLPNDQINAFRRVHEGLELVPPRVQNGQQFVDEFFVPASGQP